ncbi:MAG: hypothetical protein KC535_04960 [Nanoarchaeota archaeon]|nr:hypothetical protein [Nanoarchaeota archaeon]
MEKDGMALAIRFAHRVNEQCYCGPEGCHNTFIEYLEHGTNKEQVREDIAQFESLGPYLMAIAKKNGKDFLDFDVAEAYWIGNELLDDFKREEMKSIIYQLVKRIPSYSIIAVDRLERLTEGYVPHHNFHVMYMGGGNTFGKLPTTIEFMELCRVSWGTVTEVSEENLELKVTKNELVEKDKKLKLIEKENQIIKYHPSFINPKVNDVVAIHHKVANMVLTPDQQERLEKYTNLILDLRNLTW